MTAQMIPLSLWIVWSAAQDGPECFMTLRVLGVWARLQGSEFASGIEELAGESTARGAYQMALNLISTEFISSPKKIPRNLRSWRERFSQQVYPSAIKS